MFKIGPETRMDAPSLVKEASADDPIYTRGFAVGETRSRPSSSDTAATTSPESKKGSPSSKPDLSPFEVEARKSLEESLHRLYEQHTGQPWKDTDSEEPKPDLPSFELDARESYESAMWDRYEQATGNKRPEGAPKIPAQDDE